MRIVDRLRGARVSARHGAAETQTKHFATKPWGDLGAFHALWFSDPDGMRGEVSLIVDAALAAFHAPRPLPEAPPQHLPPLSAGTGRS